jgi:hypothetical protein
MYYLNNWTHYIYNFIVQWYNYLWGTTRTSKLSHTDNNPTIPHIKHHPNARPPKSAIRHRPDDCKKAKFILQETMRTSYPYSLVEVSFRKKSEFLDVLQSFPSVELKIFFPEEYVTIASLRFSDETIIDQVLQQDWFLAVDNPYVTFGNPNHISMRD